MKLGMQTTTEQYIYIDLSRHLVVMRGEWSVFHADVIRKILRQNKKVLSSATFTADLSQVSVLDTVGAWLIRQYLGRHTNDWHMTEQQKKLLDFLPSEAPKRLAVSDTPYLVRALTRLGERTADGLAFAYGLTAFCGLIFCRLLTNLRHPSEFRPAAISRHIYETGIAALPIIGLLAFLMSTVVSYQGAIQLQKFGADIFTIDLTVISMLREMAPLVTAIMVAGRSGSAFAAEIGVMRLRKETDALESMGLDPISLLVLPRLLALLLTLPLLTFFADIVGIAGGALMSYSLIDIPPEQYIARVAETATPTMFMVGMIKAPVFAMIIATICTYHGMKVTGSAESVGRVTTVSVVQTIFMVIFADAIFSIIFAELDI